MRTRNTLARLVVALIVLAGLAVQPGAANSARARMIGLSGADALCLTDPGAPAAPPADHECECGPMCGAAPSLAPSPPAGFLAPSWRVVAPAVAATRAADPRRDGDPRRARAPPSGTDPTGQPLA
ncbi:MAG: hypothetical protein IPL88_16230 [Rhizobiales bacterium]|nr:hypothetical protein [Hyphomicrobiales bacterium]